MILKSFQILAICTSMAVTPSNFQNDQVKKANETYTSTITIQYKANTTITLSQQDSKYVSNYKYEGTKIQDEFLIKQYIYTQTYYYDEGQDHKDIGLYPINNRDNCSILTVIQISPYRTTQNNVAELNLKLNFQTGFYETVLDQANLITEQYTSTESYWDKYIDTNISTPYLNYEAIQDITDSTKGFTYAKQIYTQTITETLNQTTQNINVETNLYINPTKTNYIYYYTYATINGSDPNLGMTARTFGSIPTFLFPQSNATVITGERVAPITGYEVVDIPGIMWEVLSMPFTFISIAFNLTLFPNTPYQVNLSNLFLSILGALIFIFIMSKFVFKK